MQTINFLENWVVEKGLPKYRAKQIYQAVTKNLISDWDEAIELPKDWQETLSKELPISTLKVKKILPDDLGRDNSRFVPTNADTVKIAFQTHDSLIIESVLMKHSGNRNTICVSTQIGCPMNCAFCATGKLGLTRNLTVEEIVDQVLEFARMLKKQNEHITNVVFMGMGEPFLNYDNVIESIKILNDKDGFNLGHRHMTISTSGIVPGIERFADEKIQVNPANSKINLGSGGVNLAISLHAPNDEIRNKIMPVNLQYPLEKLLPAVSGYMDKTGRKVFFEYILLKGINDSDKDIEELASLLKDYFSNQMQLVHVNLIGFNLIEATGADQGLCVPSFEPTSQERTRSIFDLLQKNKILTTIRYKFGDDISAACGQLAGK